MLTRIGTVAKIVNLSVRRILQYEKEGLLLPREKTDGGHRLYSEKEIDHIKNIMHLIHDHGMTLAGIKALLLMSPCWRIFPCQHKDNCSAYKTPEFVCWELRQKGSGDYACDGECERCPIFLVRDYKTDELLSRFASLFRDSQFATAATVRESGPVAID